MSHNYQKYLAMAALLPLALSPAQAQESAATDEIIVTASSQDRSSALKTGLPLIDVPQSLSITGSEDIKQRGFNELGDIVRYTPGVTTSQGEGHRDSVVFRGVRSTADFFIDGVRDDVQYYRPLYNIEQVEILRGANALLFGRGGTGGAINRVSKKAVIGGSDSTADINVDTFGGYNLATDVNMTTGQNSALRINAFVETLENDRDFYDGDRLGVNPTLRVALSEQTTLDLSLELMDHERFIDRGIPTNRTTGAPQDSVRDIVFASEQFNTSTLEASILRGSLTRKFSDSMTGVVSLHYGDYEKMYQNLYGSGYDGTNITMKGYRDPTDRTNTILSGYLTNEIVAAGMKHTLLVGAEFVETESENRRYNPAFSANGAAATTSETFTVTNPLNLTRDADDNVITLNFDETAANLKTSSDTEISVTSLFIQDQIAVTENLQVLLGARMDNFDITIKDTKAMTTETREDEEVSPRFGLIYKPQSNVSFYASMSESFLPRSGEQFKSLSESNARLDPDVYENTEYGVKWDYSDALSITASFFDNESERATTDGQGSGFIQYLVTDGYELEIDGRVSDNTSISFGYTALDGSAPDGKQAYELPETSYSLFVSHQANERLNFGIGLTYQDESLVKQKDGASSRTAEPQHFMPDYTRVDASISYILSDATTLRVNIENLTDEEYYPHSHATDQISVGDPMNAQISLTRKF